MPFDDFLARLLGPDMEPIVRRKPAPLPQSAMSYPQLVSRGPAYGSQAARTQNAPSIFEDPLYQQMVGAGMAPIQAMEFVVGQRMASSHMQTIAAQPEPPPTAPPSPELSGGMVPAPLDEMTRRDLEARRMAADIERTRQAAEEIGGNPDPGTFGGMVAQLARGGASVASDAVTNPLDTAKAVGAPVLDALGYGQRYVALMQAGWAIDLARGDKDAEQIRRAFEMNALHGILGDFDAELFKWAGENKAEVLDAAENGFDRVDNDGNVIEHVPAGPEAVLAAFEASMGGGVGGFIRNLAYGVSTDPLMAVPIVGALGRGARTVGAAARTERATGAGRALGAAVEGAGTVLETAAKVPDLPVTGVTRSLGALGRGIRRTPLGEAIEESAPSIARGQAHDRSQAIEQFAKADAALPMTRGMTPPDLTTAAPDIPPGTLTDEPFAGTALAEPVLPAEDLGYLNPREGGGRAIDDVAYDVGPRAPDKARAFWDAYQERARAYLAEMGKLDRTPPVRMNGEVIEDYKKVALQVKHYANDIAPLYREIIGEEPRAYKTLAGDDLRNPPNVARDNTGKVTNAADVAKQTRRGADLNNLIEQAVVNPDDVVASNIRYWMRRQPDESIRRLADDLKQARSSLYGPESVAEGKTLRARADAATADFATDVPPVGDTLPPPLNDLEQRIADIDAKIEQWREFGRLNRSGKNTRYTPSEYEVRQTLKGFKEQRAKLVAQLDAAGRQQTTPFPELEPAAGTTPFPEPPVLGGNRPARESLTDEVSPPDMSYDPLFLAKEAGDIDEDQFAVLSEMVEYNGTPARVVDVYASFLADGLDPRRAKQATIEALKPAGKQSGKLRAMLRAYDAFTAGVREHIMYNAVRGPLTILANQLGDAFGYATSGNLPAAINSFDPRLIRAQIRNVRQGTTDYLTTTSVGRTLDRLDIAGVGERLGIEMGREEVERLGEMSLHRLVERITGSHRLAQLTGVLQSEWMRDLTTATEAARRFSLYGDTLARELPAVRDDFFTLLRDTGARKGIDAEQMIAGLGDEFSPRDIRRLAAQAGMKPGDAEQLARQWRSRLNALDKMATRETDRVAFNYGKTTKADEVMRRLFLFHFWQTRAAPLYLANAVRNPALASAYYRMAEDLKRECEETGGPCGYLELLSSAPGFSLYFKPLALVSTTLMNFEPDWNSPDATMLDRVIGYVPAMFNPLLQSAVTALGWSARSTADPLASTTFRKTFGSIIDFGKARGWPGLAALPGDARLPDPVYDTFVQGIYRAANDWLDLHPGDPSLRQLDPTAQGTILVQSRIQELVVQEYDLDPLLPFAEWPEAAQERLIAAQTALETGQGGDPIADQALRDYTRAAMLGRGAAMGTFGGVRVRSDRRDDLLAARREGNQAAYDLIDITEAATPEATALRTQEPGYRAIGAERPTTEAPGAHLGKLGNTIWAKIVHDPLNAGPIYIGGKQIENADLAEMPQDMRELVAEQWLAERNMTDNVEAFRTERGAYLDENPELAAYDEWADGMRRQGATTAIAALARSNPNYRRYLDALPEEIKRNRQRYELAALSTDAYLAAQGQRAGAYDPIPIATSDPSQMDTASIAAGLTGGGEANQTRQTKKDPAARLMESMARYQTDVLLFDQVLKQMTGNPNASLETMNPMLRQAWEAQLASLGISAPQMPGEVRDYLRWASMQPPGSDTSIQAFLAWQRQALGPFTGTALASPTAVAP